MRQGPVLGLAAAALLAAPTQAQEPQAGVEYSVLDEQRCLVPNSGKVEIVEVFSYTCIYCYRLETELLRWSAGLPEQVSLLKMPVVWSSGDEALARLFWAMQTAGVDSPEVDEEIYGQIHNRRRPFATLDNVLALADGAGLDDTRISRLVRSFLVNTRVRLSRSLTRSWRIVSTPSFVVAGRYLVAINRKNNMTRQQMLEVAQWLANRELANGDSSSCARP